MLSIQQNYANVPFKAGLNNNVVRLQHVFDCKFAEKYLQKQGINSNFLNNKSLALATNIAVDILNKLHSTFDFFYFWSPSINVYNTKDLLLDNDLYHFCIPEQKNVLTNHPTFEPASIFYSNVSSLEELDFQSEQAKKLGLKNTNHYLADIIHEMMHAVYLNTIYKKYGKKSLLVLQKLEQKCFTPEENEVIKNVIGQYATNPLNQYHEVFADTFTKSICDSISTNEILPMENPLDKFKKYPKEFINIMKKVLNV